MNKHDILTETVFVSIGDSFVFEDVEIKLLDIGVDSRCPKSVMCARAGDVMVKITVYKSRKQISEKTIAFTPTVYLPYEKGNLVNSETLKITAVALSPYPVVENNIKKSDYKLKLLLEETI